MAKILCIVDSYSWALANRAKNLQQHYKQHNFLIKHFRDINKIRFDNFNIVYVLNWPIHGYIHKKIFTNRKCRLITSVSSHIGRKSANDMKNLFKHYDAISVSNNFLYKEFNNVYKSKVYYTPFGVNDKIFKPTSNPSEKNNIFGWVGNPSRKVKRYKEIVDVIKNIEGAKLLTVFGGKSRKQMANFYNQVGTVICFSKSEGTPNPILEAAACGRSIISTRVGNVPELVNRHKTISIVNSKQDLKKAIIRNIKNPSIIENEGKFLRKRVTQEWSWKYKAKPFAKFLGI